MMTLSRQQWQKITITWMAAILALSLMPVRIKEPSLWNDMLSNSAHVAMYAVLTFGLLRAFDRRVYVFSFLTAFCYGVLMEILQGFTSCRSPELLDVISNAVGILAVLAWLRGKEFK